MWRSPSRPTEGVRTIARAVGVLGLCGALLGCGDPPPDPATAPIEVVLDSCTLNRDTVGNGAHSVAVLGSGSLVVTDPAGKVVLRAQGSTVDQPSLTTASGRYTFTCSPPGASTSPATLESAG